MSRWGDFPPTLFPEIYLISGLELECDCEWDDITNIILKDHPELINEYMEIFNTYSFRTVSSPVWKQALYEFSQNYGVSLRDVEVEMGYNVSR